MIELVQALTRIKNTGFSPAHVLDIGAYEGEWAKAASVIFEGCSVLMLEAQQRTEARLAGLKAFAADRFDYRIVLLGAENKASVPFFQMDTSVGSTGSSLYEENTDFPRSVVELPMVRLDDLVAQVGAGPFGVVKLDVQGAELDVLRGGPQTLAAAQFVVLEVSTLPYNKGAPLFAEVVAFMHEQGFDVVDLFEPKRDAKDQMVQVDLVFARRDSEFMPKISLQA